MNYITIPMHIDTAVGTWYHYYINVCVCAYFYCAHCAPHTYVHFMQRAMQGTRHMCTIECVCVCVFAAHSGAGLPRIT